MVWSWGGRALCVAARRVPRPILLLAAACATALGGCTFEGNPSISAAQPRGATVAFESIDGPPAGQFQKLVQDLNDEAQSRRLAVISRDSPAAYRVRGYVAAKVIKGQTSITWVWDVFDAGEHRVLRIDGEETVKSHHRDAWAAADDAMLRRIARSSIEQIAAFLISPEVAPNGPATAGAPEVAFRGTRDAAPEAAGIFHVPRPHADPIAAKSADSSTAMPTQETLTLAASNR